VLDTSVGDFELIFSDWRERHSGISASCKQLSNRQGFADFKQASRMERSELRKRLMRYPDHFVGLGATSRKVESLVPFKP
jgi:hypothetical protein